MARAEGAWAEVLSLAESGARLRVRYTGEGGNSSSLGTEDTMAVDEIVSVSPAPPGPQWSEGVTVLLHRVPETGGPEGGFEATGMRGVPLGVPVIAFEDSARERSAGSSGR